MKNFSLILITFIYFCGEVSKIISVDPKISEYKLPRYSVGSNEILSDEFFWILLLLLLLL
jgi:hypothetical protein